MLKIIINEDITHVSLVPQTLKWLMDAGLTQPYSIEKIFAWWCEAFISSYQSSSELPITYL